MISIQYLLTLLMLVSSFTLSPPHDVSKTKCATITRAKIEKRLGQPIKCFKQPKNVECFGREQEPVRVLFNEPGVAKRIEISNLCYGIDDLKRELNQIVPEKTRGKYRQRVELSALGSCKSIYEEEYECLKIKYSQENCMGCAPASITVEWK